MRVFMSEGSVAMGLLPGSDCFDSTRQMQDSITSLANKIHDVIMGTLCLNGVYFKHYLIRVPKMIQLRTAPAGLHRQRHFSTDLRKAPLPAPLHTAGSSSE